VDTLNISIAFINCNLRKDNVFFDTVFNSYILILIGPPGAGKTMLARRLPTILPPLTLAEALETTKIHSVAGILSPETALVHTRPFRSPHHTISDTAIN
jgi:predicted ATPase with chaperone activity